MAKAITLERAAWEALFWPEGVPRYIEAYKDGSLDRNWIERVGSDHDRLAVVTADATITYGEIESSATLLADEFPEGCQFAVLAELTLPRRQVALVAARKKGIVPVFVDAASQIRSLALLNLSNSNSLLIGDSDLPISPGKRVDSKRLDEIMSSGRSTGLSEQRTTASPGAIAPRSGKSIRFAEDGSPVHVTDKMLASRLDSIRTFFSIEERTPTFFYVGPISHTLCELSMGLALQLGGTIVCLEGLSSLPGVAKEKKLNLSYGFLQQQQQVGDEDHAGVGSVSLKQASGMREVTRGCRWVLSTIVDASAQARLERALRVPVLGCLSTVRTGTILSNHYAWNVHGCFGIPVPGAEAAISAKTGPVLATGQSGELIVNGPQVDIERAPDKLKAGANWLKTGLTVEFDLNGLIHPFVQQ